MRNISVVLCACGFLAMSAAGAKGGSAPDGIIRRGNTTFTSFENLRGSQPDRSDVTNFRVGDVLFGNKNAAVAAAATRGFKPGYRSGDFVFITAGGTSVLTVSSRRNKISFWAKDIAELNPNVDGKLKVYFRNGVQRTISVPQKFTRFNFKDVSQILVITNGITNIDDFTYIKIPGKRRGRIRPAF